MGGGWEDPPLAKVEVEIEAAQDSPVSGETRAESLYEVPGPDLRCWLCQASQEICHL